MNSNNLNNEASMQRYVQNQVINLNGTFVELETTRTDSNGQRAGSGHGYLYWTGDSADDVVVQTQGNEVRCHISQVYQVHLFQYAAPTIVIGAEHS